MQNWGSKTNLPDDAQVAMERIDRIQKCRQEPEGVHARHQLVSDLPALSHPNDNGLSAAFLAFRDRLDCPHKSIAAERVCGVQARQVEQSVSFRSKYVCGGP